MLWSILVGALVAGVVMYDVLPLALSRVLRLGVVRVGPRVPQVALTFDDGPDPNYTPRLLDALTAEQVKATFFVIATKAALYPDLIQRMVSEGHQVEIHGLTHACVPLLRPKPSVSQIRGSVRILRDQCNVSPKWYRPTWGMINLPAWIAARVHGLRFITWSIMVGDWRLTEPQELLQRVMRRLHAGAIIVLHDSDETPGAQSGAPNSVIAMMPDLVHAVRSEGYTFELLANWM